MKTSLYWYRFRLVIQFVGIFNNCMLIYLIADKIKGIMNLGVVVWSFILGTSFISLILLVGLLLDKVKYVQSMVTQEASRSPWIKEMQDDLKYIKERLNN